jgi:3'-phosphoadenosine 5'-phosphosulfate sulfotransferase (PAPS reductase)/FAD synthetase
MKNLLVSFSGGETSAFMAQWLNNHYEGLGYENIVFVFANTGLENE